MRIEQPASKVTLAEYIALGVMDWNTAIMYAGNTPYLVARR
jgi:hypothetical protein